MSYLNTTIGRAEHAFDTLRLNHPELSSLDYTSTLFEVLLAIEEVYEARHQLKTSSFQKLCTDETYQDFARAASPHNPNANSNLIIAQISLALLELKNKHTDLDPVEIYENACYIANRGVNVDQEEVLKGTTVEDILPTIAEPTLS